MHPGQKSGVRLLRGEGIADHDALAVAGGDDGVACGVFAFVLGGTYYGATEKLLEEGDYTRHSKATRELRTAISVVYWLVVTAAFLLYTFGPRGNGQPQYSWFIWAIGGILYAALVLVVKMALRKQNNK